VWLVWSGMFVCTCWYHLTIKDSGIFFLKLKVPSKYEGLREQEDTFALGAVKQREIKKSDFSREHA